MNYQRTLITWVGVVILLFLGVVGYTQGWFGEIFGSGFEGTRATTATLEAFNQGTYTDTQYKDGALTLKPVGGAQ